MKEKSFTLKSYRKGLALHIHPQAEMETLLAELKEKFETSRQFFGTMQVGIALSGKELTLEEEAAILNAIGESSDLQVVCLIGEDEKMKYLFEEALAQTPKQEDAQMVEGQFYRGTLKKGQSIETEHSITIIGDINPGAKVFSKKDVIVVGALLGEVHAGIGMEEGEGRFVCATEFSPEKLKIGNYKYEKKPEKRFWPDSYKKAPKMATLQGEEIIVKPITKEFLGQVTIHNND